MDADEANAKGAQVAGLVVGSAVSVIPVFGGPASVVATYFGNLPMQRRTERILGEIQDEMARLSEGLDNVDVTILESETFNAALYRVVHASLETAEETKRTALRNVLLNGYVKGDFSDQGRFLRLMAQYEPEHLVVLHALQSITEGREARVQGAILMIHVHLKKEVSEDTIRACLTDLVNDGLVERVVDTEIREQNVGVPNGILPARTRQVPYETPYHAISERGRAFLDVVASPLVE
jgi:hypothetical protein